MDQFFFISGGSLYLSLTIAHAPVSAKDETF